MRKRTNVLIVAVLVLSVLVGVGVAAAQEPGVGPPGGEVFIPYVDAGDDVIGLVEVEAVGASAAVTGNTVVLSAGETITALCPGGTLRVSRPSVSGQRDKSQAILRCVVPATPTPILPTHTPTVTPTSTPIPPTSTPVTGVPSAPVWVDATGMRGEYGMAPAIYQKLMVDAASGAFDRPCTESEHDPAKWHTLLNYAAGCHYNHQHGDNPHGVSDLFGEIGASFGIPGEEIGHPWQTYAAHSDGAPILDADGSYQWENEYKHAGYFWAVRRDQCANADDPAYCVDAFRILVHGSVMGRAVRWHSYRAEIRTCTNGNNPATCSNAQVGGWIDTFALFTPPYAAASPGLCDNPFNGAYYSENGLERYINDFGLSNQFVPRDDPDLQDEQRCHRQLPDAMVAQYPNGLPYSDTAFSPPAEWWHHTPWDFRFNVFFYNPFAESDQAGALKFYCAAGEPACRWTQSRFTLNVDYVFPVMSWHRDFSGYITRFGDYGRNCSGPALDCIYTDYSQVPGNPNGLGYLHTRDGERRNGGTTEPLDYDITPAGQPSWITWFR